jgi:hypothetical protein
MPLASNQHTLITVCFTVITYTVFKRNCITCFTEMTLYDSL